VDGLNIVMNNGFSCITLLWISLRSDVAPIMLTVTLSS
jgi:hypothetical protein